MRIKCLAQEHNVNTNEPTLEPGEIVYSIIPTTVEFMFTKSMKEEGKTLLVAKEVTMLQNLNIVQHVVLRKLSYLLTRDKLSTMQLFVIYLLSRSINKLRYLFDRIEDVSILFQNSTT